MGRDTIQLENAVSTISQEYLLEFTSEYGIPKDLHPELPGSEDTIVDFSEGKVGVYTKFFEFANYCIPISQFLFDILGHYQIHLSQLSVIGAAKNWNNSFFWDDERIFPTVVDWRTRSPKYGMPLAGSYSAADVAALDTNRTSFQKLPETLLCLVGLSRNYYLGDDVYPTFLYDDDQGMEDTTMASGSSGTPSTIEKSPLDFDNENPTPSTTEGVGVGDQAQDGLAYKVPSVEIAMTTKVIQEPMLEKEVSAMGPPVNKRRRHRGTDKSDANALPKVLRKDHATPPSCTEYPWGESLSAMGLEAGSTFTHVAQETSAGAKSISDPDLLSYARPPPHSEQDVAQSSKGKATEILPQYVATTEGVTNSCRLDTPEACQDMVDHTVPLGYFSELLHLPNTEFLGQYNMNLARQVARGSQLRLRFEQEVRLLKEARAKIARRDQRIQVREEE
ncbi:hypothetical protein Tco_0998373, partial [Tanacetum coccineum]